MRISTLMKMISVPLALAALYGCSGQNGSASPVVDASGKHPANWVQQHWVHYKQMNGGSKAVSSATGCSECHGADLTGGTSKVSCFQASFQGIFCHDNGDRTLGHPEAWSDLTMRGFHGSPTATYNGQPVRGSANLATACGLCHAIDTNSALIGSAPSCLSTDPKWGMACHASSPAAQSTGCVSCHATPPAGATAPNRGNAHAKHLALNGVSCNTCHTDYGTGTEKHATGNGSAFVKFAAAYNAKSGTANFSADKCSGVSCHGGKQTPAWAGGSLAVATDCLSCHELGSGSQSPQYNSFYSGNIVGGSEHDTHLGLTNPGTGRLIYCTDCHDLAKLTAAQHFGGLATPAFEGTPSDTIGGGSTRITSYDKTTTNCNNSCHSAAPNPVRWQL